MALPWLKAQTNSETPIKGTLCILLGEQTVSAALTYLTPTETRVSTISLQRQFKDIETFVAATDECLRDLGEESNQINQAVFCLSEHWVDAHDVLPQKVAWIEQVLTELSLQALGFIGLIDGFTSLLLKQTSKATQLVFFIFPHTITLSVLVGTHVITTLSVGRSTEIADDFTELLARIKSRLTENELTSLTVTLASPDLSDGQLDILQQSLLEYDWQKIVPEATLPQLTLIKQEELYRHLFHQTAEILRSKQLGAQWHSDPLVQASKSAFGQEVADSVAASMPMQSDFISPSVSKADSEAENQDSEQGLSRRKKGPKLGFSLFLSGKRKKRLLFAGLGFVFGVLVLGIMGAFYLRQYAELLITIQPKRETITKDVVVALSEGSLKITDDYSLPIETVQESVEVTAAKVTTGTKTIGEKAKGRVKVVNKTEQPKLLESGTTLTSGTGLVFLLDEAITVPAATVSATSTGEVKSYGSLETNATAKEIGDKSNIGNGQDLKVASFSDTSYSAQSIQAFTGGSSKDVAVVTEKDIFNLRTQLKKQAAQKAQKSLDEMKTEGKRIAPPHEISISKEQVSAKVGDEAEEITLTITATAKAFAYDSQDTRNLAQAILANSIPSGTILDKTEPQVLTKFSEATSSAKTQLELNISAKVVSQVNTNQIAQALVGRPVAAINPHAVELPGVDAVTAEWIPKFALWLNQDVPKVERIRVYVTE